MTRNGLTLLHEACEGGNRDSVKSITEKRYTILNLKQMMELLRCMKFVDITKELEANATVALLVADVDLNYLRKIEKSLMNNVTEVNTGANSTGR